jgi:hypothetical protein
MGIFHPTGVALSTEGKRHADYLQFRPYYAIASPTLLPQKQRDAFLKTMGVQVKRASASGSVRSLRSTNGIAYIALAVLVFLAIALGVLWRLHLL